MTTIGASEFKARCLRIIDEVAATGEPVTITKHGKVVVRLVPAVEHRRSYPQEELLGTVEVVGDIVEPVVEPDRLSFDAENVR